MLVNGEEAKQYNLDHGRIIKKILKQSDELTIRFVNGLLGNTIPLDAKVYWLDIDAGYYLRINGLSYFIIVERDANASTPKRVFEHMYKGALWHDTVRKGSKTITTFPQPCVIFLKGSVNTPSELRLEISYFNGEKQVLYVPTTQLTELSVREIAERNLFPIGQFYLQKFEPLTENNLDDFNAASAGLLRALEDAVERKVIPYHRAIELYDTIYMTVQNIAATSDVKDANITVNTKLVDTFPWINYDEIFEKLKHESKTEGKTERDMEHALNAFKDGSIDPALVVKLLKIQGIPDETIAEAQKHVQTEHQRQARRRSNQER
jgi:hypothetical protein